MNEEEDALPISLEDCHLEIATLKSRVKQLEKINAVLSKRVKRGMDSQGDAFALFHTATALEQQVAERTSALEKANTELKEALVKEKALAQARDKALDASHLKSQFLANMSHEIRTPMNGVIGMTSLLMDTPLSDEQRDFVHIIRTSGESLLTIINDILDFSKIEAKKLVLERHPFELRTCVEEALDLVASAAATKDIELLYLIEDGTPEIITSDITRLRQIIVNLLSNAVKFTDGGEIFVYVTATCLEDDVYSIDISVKDSGIGIPADRLESLFDAFSQVDASTTRKYGGTGLGLAISHQLATLLGGGIRVESTLGEGSTFIVTLVAPASKNRIQIDVDALEGKQVLIVDDSATNRRILHALTQAWGMQPVVVSSGTEVLKLFNEGNTFDVALLDFHMPEMDGVMLAQTLSHHTAASSLPLIMLSSIGDRQKATGAEFAKWLTKPVKPDQLYRALAGILGGNVQETEPPKLQQTNDAANLRILLAEDNGINQKVAVRMLQRLGYRADVVANGIEAINALSHISYDLILMDVMMPEMDGIEATKAIREQLNKHQPCIIALTASAMEEDRQKCLAAGMDDYLSKPIKPELLELMLSRWAHRIQMATKKTAKA